MDAFQAFIQFLTDLFAALAEFLGTAAFGSILNGIGEVKGTIDEAMAD